MKLDLPVRPLLWPLVLAAGFGLWGLRWGLPSLERAQLVLSPAERNEEFYQKVEKARDTYYEAIGTSPIAYLGKMVRRQGYYESPVTMMSSYSSFMVRSHDGDEQNTLVMLSRLNPLKGQWYPHVFQYGGAYLFPLAAYMASLHVLKIIILTPHAAFYYAHPDAMANVFLAIRFWSFLGFLFAVSAVFFMGRELGDENLGIWGACFFALAPVVLAYAKVCKPHVWAGAWTLWMVFFCIRAAQDRTWKSLLLAAACFGLTMGSAISQVMYAPFLVWACWDRDLRQWLGRAAAIFLASGTLYLLMNFYILNHFSDFQDELSLFKNYSLFKWRLSALWEFFGHALPVCSGIQTWFLFAAGFVTVLVKRAPPRLWPFVLSLAACMVWVSLQFQDQRGSPPMGRLFLGMIGLSAVIAAWWTFQVPWGRAARWACLILMIGQAAVYCEHFRSDRYPGNNETQASFWIRDHVPAGSVLIHTLSVPHVGAFPPVEFSRYRLVSLMHPQALTLPEPLYAVISGKQDAFRSQLVEAHFSLVTQFYTSPLQILGMEDPFLNANYPVEIYERPYDRIHSASR